MEVILLEKIRGLGAIGDVRNVKDGFARNFLLPRKKVLRATASNKAMFELKKAELERANLERKAEAEKIGAQIADMNVVIIRQAGDDGRLFGSVMTQDVANMIHSLVQIKIHPEYVIIPNRIKEIGIYPIDIELHPDVRVVVQLNIARSEQEAGAALEKLKAEAGEKLKAEAEAGAVADGGEKS